MARERRQVYRAFYRRLLSLYPKAFRDRFGESMAQTFDDLCDEQGDTRPQLIYFTVRESIDAGVGIAREQISYLLQRRFMHDKAYSITGFLFMLPAIFLLGGLMFNVEPPIPAALQGPPDGPHIVGSLIALTLIIVFPIVGLLINILPIRRGLFAWPDLLTAGGIGLLFVAPFLLLEMTYGFASYSNFPVPLFGILWLLGSAFVAILLPIGRSLMTADGPRLTPTTLVLSAVVLAIIATLWIGIVVDQMPCFLGVPNCD